MRFNTLTSLWFAAVLLTTGIEWIPSALAQEEARVWPHVATIKALRYDDAKKGRELYALHCASCHGNDGNLALNPLARRFAKDEFKFGSDPYSLWKTISYGNGLMFRWDAVLTAKERYQVAHFISELIIKDHYEGNIQFAHRRDKTVTAM